MHADRGISILVSIFYESYLSGHLPDNFMKTIIITLIKKQDMSNDNNYRHRHLNRLAQLLQQNLKLFCWKDALKTFDRVNQWIL